MIIMDHSRILKLLLITLIIQKITNRCPLPLFSNAFSVIEEEGNESGNGYTIWKQNKEINCKDYDHYIYLKRDGIDVDAAFHWRIVNDQKSIKIALITKSTGWSAFGIAESGGMPGADIAVFTISEDRVRDYHATAYAPPKLDEYQDWKLISHSVTDDGFLIWEAERLLDTGDVHGDHVILNNTMDPSFPATKIIVAWGDSSSLSYHGSNKVKGEVNFFANDNISGKDAEEILIQKMEDESNGSFLLVLQNIQFRGIKPRMRNFVFHWRI